MKYFITVNTLNSTTKLGRLLADRVFRHYNNALVYYGEANQLPQYIQKEMDALCNENKRLKPMQLRLHGFSKGQLNSGASAQIYAVTEAGAKAFTDNRPFTIHLTPVMKDYTQKGGEK